MHFPGAEQYKVMDSVRTHAYQKPSMYLGSDKKLARQEWLFHVLKNTMVNSEIELVPAVERIFVELITNAADNVGNSRTFGVDPGDIQITMSNTIISIKNGGLPMAVEIHSETGLYCPELLCGNMFSSSHYEGERRGGGTNGIGCKLANIFSKSFCVVVEDHIRRLKFTQTWTDNMLSTTGHLLSPFSGKKSSVEITYKLDFERFGYTEYPIETSSLFARHAADISFNVKVPVVFNGHTFKFFNIKDYATLYFEQTDEPTESPSDKVVEKQSVLSNALVHYEWPVGAKVIKGRNGYQYTENHSTLPMVELIALDTPDSGYHLSFVNAIMTREGGVHLKSAFTSFDSVVSMINEKALKEATRANKGKELTAKDKRLHTITITDVKPHISILVAVRMVDPDLIGQTKSQLGGIAPKITLQPEELKIITKWRLLDRLKSALDAKRFDSLSKGTAKKSKHVNLENLEDANNAGDVGSEYCELWLTEGKSGAGYAYKRRAMTTNGPDKIGVLPMRGKSLNVMKAAELRIDNNEEIKALRSALGLNSCTMDYTSPENFKTLRYGKVLIMADADMDGTHIAALILNFFHHLYPSLLKRSFVQLYKTPIVRVTVGRIVHKFFTEQEYHQWRLANENTNMEIKYFKGLGTSKKEHVKDDQTDPYIVSYDYDSEAPVAMKLAFHKDQSKERKEWILNWKPGLETTEVRVKNQTISDFIKSELVIYSVSVLKRAIPKLMDGFKESQRKLIHGAFLKWNVGPLNKTYKEFKVAQFGAFVSDKTAYHHGEAILGKVAVAMAQDFVGSNNLPWFTQEGSFGSRYELGKDAGDTRYLNTMPHPLFAYILRKEDQNILDYLDEEGQSIEPKTYYPIVPMVLINGANGIATGYSTRIPCHNPLDIIHWLISKLTNNRKLPTINPWYRNFNGELIVIDRRKEKYRAPLAPLGAVPENVDEDTPFADEGILDPELADTDVELIETEPPLLSLETRGIFKVEGKKVIITELPIDREPKKYRIWVESLIKDKLAKDCRNLSGEEKVHFEIIGFNNPTLDTLRLRKRVGMSNMLLLNTAGYPERYNTAEEILETFYTQRLAIYEQRKQTTIQNVRTHIQRLVYKKQFVQAIRDKIIIPGTGKAQMHQTMKSLNIPIELLNTVKFKSTTIEDVKNLDTKISQQQAILNVLIQTDVKTTWLAELQELEVQYKKHFK